MAVKKKATAKKRISVIRKTNPKGISMPTLQKPRTKKKAAAKAKRKVSKKRSEASKKSWITRRKNAKKKNY